jgi:hypothetical protein
VWRLVIAAGTILIITVVMLLVIRGTGGSIATVKEVMR